MKYKYAPMGIVGLIGNKELNKLATFAKDGYELKRVFGSAIYQLEKTGISRDVQYQYITEKIDRDYEEMLNASGWKIVIRKRCFAIIEGSVDATPLETDPEMTKQFLLSEIKRLFVPTVVTFFATTFLITIFKDVAIERGFNEFLLGLLVGGICGLTYTMFVLPFFGNVYQFYKFSTES